MLQPLNNKSKVLSIRIKNAFIIEALIRFYEQTVKRFPTPQTGRQAAGLQYEDRLIEIQKMPETTEKERELKRQIDSSLYERLLLTKGITSKNKIITLSKKGQQITKPEDIVKNEEYLYLLKDTTIYLDTIPIQIYSFNDCGRSEPYQSYIVFN